MSEPDFSSQTSERHTFKSAALWFETRADEDRKRGATYTRTTKRSIPTTEGVIVHYLCESWRVRPEVLPEPHFHLAPAPCR